MTSEKHYRSLRKSMLLVILLSFYDVMNIYMSFGSGESDLVWGC